MIESSSHKFQCKLNEKFYELLKLHQTSLEILKHELELTKKELFWLKFKLGT